MADYPITNIHIEKERSLGSGPVKTYFITPQGDLTPPPADIKRPMTLPETTPERRARAAAAQKRKSKYNMITKEFLQEQLAAGKTPTQIEKELNMRRSSIFYHLKKHGLR